MKLPLAHRLDFLSLPVEDALDLHDLGLQFVVAVARAGDAGPQVGDVSLTRIELKKVGNFEQSR